MSRQRNRPIRTSLQAVRAVVAIAVSVMLVGVTACLDTEEEPELLAQTEQSLSLSECEACEDYCGECGDRQRCGTETRYYCEFLGHCGRMTCGISSGYETRPVACMCRAPNQCLVGTPMMGYCADCPEGQLCDDLTNECYTPGCTWPNAMCDGVCTPVVNNDDHCGSCDNACATNEFCDGTTCVPSCSWPYRMCDGVCTLVVNNDDHCGSCDNACAWDQVCDYMRCVGGGVIPF